MRNDLSIKSIEMKSNKWSKCLINYSNVKWIMYIFLLQWEIELMYANVNHPFDDAKFGEKLYKRIQIQSKKLVSRQSCKIACIQWNQSVLFFAMSSASMVAFFNEFFPTPSSLFNWFFFFFFHMNFARRHLGQRTAKWNPINFVQTSFFTLF